MLKSLKEWKLKLKTFLNVKWMKHKLKAKIGKKKKKSKISGTVDKTKINPNRIQKLKVAK